MSVDQSSNPTRRQSHPGWLMLLIAAAAVFMSAPGQSFSVAAFVDPMLLELQLDRTNYSVAYMVATLIGGLILPFIGRTVDRLGARIVLPIVAIGLGLGCCWMSQLTGIVSLYAGFTLIRCLGQGSLTLIGNWIVGEWFEEYRGRAAGICGVGGTLSVLIIPQLNDVLINHYGWRQAWIILGATVVVTLVVPVIWLLRDRPEAVGLLPDGKFPAADNAASEFSAETTTTTTAKAKAKNPNNAAIRIPDDQSFTAQQALKSPTFWKLASVVATVSLVGTGLVFHQVSILAERDISRTVALSSLGVQAAAATVSTLLAGYLIDRMAARFVLATSMLLEIFAILLLLFLPGPKWVFVYSGLLGLHGGIIRSAGSMVWVNYFGRKFQGSIQGISMSLMVLAAALGPVPVALSQDLTGNYDAALWAFLLLPTCAGLAVLTASNPIESCIES